MGKPSDSTTYGAEMSQPVHRPGMERHVNRSPSPPADPRDASGDRLVGRRQVGEADPATRSHMLDEALSGSPAPKAAAAAAPAQEGTTEAGSGIGGREREAAIMDAVDKMAD